MRASEVLGGLRSRKETSPKGFSASKCDVWNWIFSKSWEFFEKLFGNVLDFVLEILVEFFGRNFWEEFLGGIFGEDFFGRIFWEDFFGRIFLGGIFREEFFGRNSLLKLKSAKLFEY